ncbi:hypothetical protein ACFC1I_10465 [Microbacterium sp. NPDC056044]|uniref:hypothetical protein n=1 Tax=Microbacterium sp. NPDC056044 TaxID=3345690 RepID=UPI0035DE2D9F
MSLAAKITIRVSALAVAGVVALAASACASLGGATPEPAAVEPAASATPPAGATPGEDEPLTELPAWARGTTWLIYPEGFRCSGTEGCGNDYVATFGEPGGVLPDGVEYYDPATHDYNPATNTGMVFPEGHDLVVPAPEQ